MTTTTKRGPRRHKPLDKRPKATDDMPTKMPKWFAERTALEAEHDRNVAEGKASAEKYLAKDAARQAEHDAKCAHLEEEKKLPLWRQRWLGDARLEAMRRAEWDAEHKQRETDQLQAEADQLAKDARPLPELVSEKLKVYREQGLPFARFTALSPQFVMEKSRRLGAEAYLLKTIEQRRYIFAGGKSSETNDRLELVLHSLFGENVQNTDHFLKLIDDPELKTWEKKRSRFSGVPTISG